MTKITGPYVPRHELDALVAAHVLKYQYKTGMGERIIAVDCYDLDELKAENIIAKLRERNVPGLDAAVKRMALNLIGVPT